MLYANGCHKVRICTSNLARAPRPEGRGVSKVRCPAVCWEPMKLHKAAHTVYKTQYHIVWVTRYRRKILVGGIAEALRLMLPEVRKFHPDWFIEEIGIVIPPKDAVAKVVALRSEE